MFGFGTSRPTYEYFCMWDGRPKVIRLQIILNKGANKYSFQGLYSGIVWWRSLTLVGFYSWRPNLKIQRQANIDSYVDLV